MKQGEKHMAQSMKTLVPFLSMIILLCATASALAQGTTSANYPKVEIFAGYSAQGDADAGLITFGPTASIGGDYTTPIGFEASVIGNFSKYFGIKGDFSAHINNDSASGAVTFCNPTCVTATQGFQLKTRVYNFLGGPEFKLRNHTRVTPFAYALAGAAHTTAEFTSTGPTLNVFLKSSENGFAMALGGGLDFRVSKRVSIRSSMDYNPVWISDGSGDRRDLARFSLGVLIH
jgi:opacity protein-like surface antigen